jgi:eukaryotic-like serine/threonine-protein kinase
MAHITDPLVLPADVQMVPVNELSENTRQHLKWEEGDIAISRPRSRTPSKVINAQSASLVEKFRTPMKMTEAIIRYCLDKGVDPYQTLNDAFAVLQDLIMAGFLVPVKSPAAEKIDLSLKNGDRIAGLTVVYAVHFLQDVELYQVRDSEGRILALKITRPEIGQATRGMLKREAEILRLLDGTVAPRLAASGEYQERAYLVMDWCPGVSVEIAAEELRQENSPPAHLKLLELVEKILQAYLILNSRGVIHGDIHPNNILVDGRGTVKLIDFGLAVVRDWTPGLDQPSRGGIGFFYEPEYARAWRVHQLPPPCSEKGEQYALGVLIYYLLSGKHYLDFSLEEDEMLRQIAEDPPLPFSHHHLETWPEMEEVLARALNKDPLGRYADISEMADRISQIMASTATPPDGQLLPPRVDENAQSLRREVMERVSLKGSLLVQGLPRAPLASLNMGAAGIAYMLYRAAGTQSDPALLGLADVWSNRAAANIGLEAGFSNAEIDLSPQTVGLISPYHTPSGVFAVQALIAHARGDDFKCQIALRQFVAAANQPCEVLDLTLGQSGLLIAGALLGEIFTDRESLAASGLLELGNSALDRIWKVINRYSPLQAAAELTNLGIAHGWGGLLLAALRWCEVSGTPLPAQVSERLNQLAELAQPYQRGIRWPWQLDHPDTFMPGWCNGAAGMLYLWTLANRRLERPLYLQLAEQCAWTCWEDPSPAASLCCGLTGRAYALLHWYRRTGDEIWLRRAIQLANQAAVNIRTHQSEEDRGFENSLYKGEVGVVALINDLDDPLSAALPFFESEGWGQSLS